MPGGTVFNQSLASAQPPGSDATAPDTFTIPASMIRAGMNVIAAQVHQVGTNSSDVVFGMRLEVTYGGGAISSAATPGAANSVTAALPAFPPIWLNELQADNVTGPTDNFGQREPWMELHNAGPAPFSLDGFYLSDSYTALTKWAFPAGVSIPANGFLTVWCDNETAQSAPNALHAGFRLASGAGRVALSRMVNSAVQLVDYLTYTNLPANWSYGDLPDGQPFYRGVMFVVTPGAANTNTSPPLSVFINEWMADNVSTLPDPADGNFEDWFEIYNPGPAPADLGGYFLTDNLTNKFQFEIPNNGHYVIPPGGYLLVWADNEDDQNSTNRADLHASLALAKGGEAIGIFAPDGTTIDAVSFGEQTTDVSQGRYPNGAATIQSLDQPTPREANSTVNTAPVLAVINDQVVTLGQTLSFQASATDGDQPSQTLIFDLADEPPGAVINPTSGLFNWTPTAAPATNTMRVIVTDNGTPNLSATQTFTVIVALPPVAGGFAVQGNQFSFSWPTVPGQHFQVEYKDDLSDANWTPSGGVLTGTGAPLTFTSERELSHQFYRLRVLP
jgi:hypothetical protein